MVISCLPQPPERWNEWITVANGGPYQSQQFAAYWSAILGYVPTYCLARAEGTDDGVPLGVLLGFLYCPLERRLFGHRARRLARWSLRPLRSFGCIDGPVVLAGEARDLVATALLVTACRRRALAGGVSAARVGHWQHGWEPQSVCRSGALSGLSARVGHTLVVRFSHGDGSPWERIPREGRKAYRRAERQGLSVRILDGADVEEARLFWGCCDAAKKGVTYGDSLPVLSSRYLAQGSFAVRYFIAELQGEWVGGLGLHCFGEVACEVAAWAHPRCAAEGLGAGDLIKGAVIDWCAAHGVTTYDLMGFTAAPRNPKEEGIARFKRKWSDEVVELHSLRSGLLLASP